MLNFSQEGIVIALSYLIPGFIINTALAHTFKLNDSTGSEAIYKYLCFSLLNLFVYSLIDGIYRFFFKDYLVNNTVFILLLRNVALPIILSLIILIFNQKIKRKDITLGNLIYLLGFDNVSRTENAWDYVFSNLPKGSYVIITLKSGEIIFGLFGSKSFSTYRNSSKNSIYLEQTYNDFDDFKLEGFGILIETENIESIRVDSNRI
ncbi:DUF6338 family protein [Lactococcus lactis]|jgi:hypothetical protein|uniref:DUF6338 family protein n=1 Tax=Lactococcus lactis TaxID=1358 RepID=UPI002417B35D|nr:DUF6338 family protein [Lactococcus lactis]MDG4958326.1 DUF6338 family protein [Lactococcus lactis]